MPIRHDWLDVNGRIYLFSIGLLVLYRFTNNRPAVRQRPGYCGRVLLRSWPARRRYCHRNGGKTQAVRHFHLYIDDRMVRRNLSPAWPVRCHRITQTIYGWEKSCDVVWSSSCGVAGRIWMARRYGALSPVPPREKPLCDTRTIRRQDGLARRLDESHGYSSNGRTIESVASATDRPGLGEDLSRSKPTMRFQATMRIDRDDGLRCLPRIHKHS